MSSWFFWNYYIYLRIFSILFLFISCYSSLVGSSLLFPNFSLSYFFSSPFNLISSFLFTLFYFLLSNMFPPQSSFLSSFPISSSSNFHSFRVLHITYPSSCHDLLLLSSLLILIRCGDVQLEGVERTCRGMDAPCQYYWSVIISFESFHPAMLCHVVLYYNISYIVISYNDISYYNITYIVISYNDITYYNISYIIVSNHIVSHISWHIISQNIIYYHIVLYLWLSCLVLPGPVISCFILSYPVLSSSVLSCPVLSCSILSSSTLSHPSLSCPTASYPDLSRNSVSSNVLFRGIYKIFYLTFCALPIITPILYTKCLSFFTYIIWRSVSKKMLRHYPTLSVLRRHQPPSRWAS